MSKITKDTTIGDIVDNYEGAKEVLSSYGMHCFGCPMSRMETLEEASAVHGVEVDEVLAKLVGETKELPEENKKKNPTDELDYDDSDFVDGEDA